MTKQTSDLCPGKIQNSLGIDPVWSDSSLCALWVAKDSDLFQADSKGSNQTGRIPCWFCCTLSQFSLKENLFNS